MPNAISRLPSSAESCGIQDWQSYYSAPLYQQLRMAQSLRDPLRHCVFRAQNITAVYGYIISANEASLVYFWCDDLKGIKWTNAQKKSNASTLLRVGILLRSIYFVHPNMHKFKALLGDMLSEQLSGRIDILEGKNIYWANLNNIQFACVYTDDGRSSSSILECLAFHLDYFKLRSPIWNVAPMRYLFKYTNHSIETLVRLHLNPKCFNPKDGPIEQAFLWPWQICIHHDEQMECLHYKTVETTSLVFDLRRSTVAMEQLRRSDLGYFSPFIKDIVKNAREVIFSHGGFFDKETGDGLVAHFIDFNSLIDKNDCGSSHKRAFDAAVEIIRSTSELCNSFMRKLRFGISDLGAAVGIHTGESVWISEDNQVRAIGESVILASRLCSEAESRNVFVSNIEFEELDKEIGPQVMSLFSKRTYKGKEFDSRATLFGYSIRIEDNI